MNEEQKKALGAALEAYDKSREESAKQQAQQIDQYLKEFLVFRNSVADPALREIGVQLAVKGHQFAIEKHDPGKSQFARGAPGIRLDILPKGFEGHRDSWPYVGFFVDLAKRKVDVFENTMLRGGTSGSVGEYDIAALTKDKVVAIAVAAIRNILTAAVAPKAK